MNGARRLLLVAALGLTGAVAGPFVRDAIQIRRDHARAIGGDTGRDVVPSPPLEEAAWRSVGADGAAAPAVAPVAAACWLGDQLIVAQRGRLVEHDASGAPVRDWSRDAAGRFGGAAQLHCAADASGVLLVDEEARTVAFLDTAGRSLGRRAAPRIPQDVPYVGTFALASTASGPVWYDSWLGSRVGPYLATEEAWATVRLATRHAGAGDGVGIGLPRAYASPVLRRVLNRTVLAARGDTLWVLTRGDATLRAFLPSGREIGRLSLPLYARGPAPTVVVGARFPSGLRRNRALYHESVGGFALVGDSLLAVLRYDAYQTVDRSTSSGQFTDWWPRSSVEIYARDGRRLRAIAIEGRPQSIASNGRDRLAVLTEQFDGRPELRVLRLAPDASPVGGAARRAE